MTLLLALIGAAIGVGSLHTLAPDHWVPFAALARAERWSAGRTAFVTAACGLGHVSVSVAMGLAALWLGIEVLARVGHRLESVSGLLLIGFGLAYAAWGFHERAAGLPHGHAHHAHPHGHSRHGARPARMTAWTLFVLFSADPCVAVIPLIFASAPLGWAGSLTVVA
ncbi:MAG TPA: hypothetical protein VEU08_18495, partial [Vicinamibacterales bacterium]|nr:hypothetical protein [Vicinamibacterales bacterium]